MEKKRGSYASNVRRQSRTNARMLREMERLGLVEVAPDNDQR